MTEKLKQIVDGELMKLPKELQETILAFDWAKITEEIGKKFSLTESEINDLQVETLLILIGLENPDLYEVNIEDNVGTSKSEAKKIAEEAGKKIFGPLNEILVEKIKKSGKVKNSNPEQTLNFILSGGDYSAFIETRDAANPTNPAVPEQTNDLKSKLVI
jgi:hypothetical protein